MWWYKTLLTQMVYMEKLLYSNISWQERIEKQRVERLFGRSLLIRGVPVKSVGHEEDVGSRWDEGMARFHNLKAQEAECTHQLSWRNKEKQRSRCSLSSSSTGRDILESPGLRLSWELTTVFSVLVKADIDTFNLQMLLGILQESSKTRGRTEEESHLRTTKPHKWRIV